MSNRNNRSRRARSVCVVMLVAATAFATWVATAQHVRAAGLALAVTPNGNLVDGQYVRVDVTGLQPSSGVAFRECISNPVNAATDCTARFPIGAAANASGTATTYVPVYSGSDLQLQNSQKALLTCDATHPCVIAAVFTLADLTNAVFANISLAPSPDSCPDPGSRAVFGSGSATAYRAIYAWQSAVCVAPYNLPVIYAVTNGVDGVAAFAQGQQQANYAVTGPQRPLTLPSSAPTYKAAPITGSAVVLAYKMYDASNGSQITNLTLTPWEISRLFLGTLFSFGTDPGVTFLNPGVTFPTHEQAYARADHSSESWVFSSFLWATLGPGSWSPGASDVFPSSAGVILKTGSRGLADAVSNPALTAFAETGNFGFMDASTAAFYGLPTVNIRLDSGAIVSATPTSVAKGLALATQGADGTYTPDYTPSDQTAYPMAVVSSMLVPTDQVTPANGKLLSAFLKYAVQGGQTILPAGYVPLPAAMVNQAMADADLIPQTAPSSAGAGSSSDLGLSSSDAGAFGGLGSEGSSLGGGYLGGVSGPGPQTSATGAPKPSAAGAGGTNSPSAGGAQIPLLASAGARWTLVALAAVAVFGVVAGPLTYALARPRPVRPWHRFKRLFRLRWPNSSMP